MKKTILIIFLTIINANLVFSADKIMDAVLCANGYTVHGAIISKDKDGGITIVSEYGNTLSFTVGQVIKITREAGLDKNNLSKTEVVYVDDLGYENKLNLSGYCSRQELNVEIDKDGFKGSLILLTDKALKNMKIPADGDVVAGNENVPAVLLLMDDKGNTVDTRVLSTVFASIKAESVYQSGQRVYFVTCIWSDNTGYFSGTTTTDMIDLRSGKLKEPNCTNITLNKKGYFALSNDGRYGQYSQWKTVPSGVNEGKDILVVRTENIKNSMNRPPSDNPNDFQTSYIRYYNNGEQWFCKENDVKGFGDVKTAKGVFPDEILFPTVNK